MMPPTSQDQVGTSNPARFSCVHATPRGGGSTARLRTRPLCICQSGFFIYSKFAKCFRINSLGLAGLRFFLFSFWGIVCLFKGTG